MLVSLFCPFFTFDITAGPVRAARHQAMVA